MKMGKKVREYKAGDFIFAKVKGYPAWPARVQRPNGKKYFVYFYGTGETANLPPNMIFDYAENKDKFLSKSVKRRDFNDGVKQIEYDFANNVPLEQVIGVAFDVPEDAPNDTTANDTADDTMNDSAADTTAADDTTMADESAVNTTSATSNETGVEDSDETGALVIDEGTGKKGRKSTAKPTGKETPKPVKEPKTPRGKKKDGAEEKEEEKKEEELVSRSGRKIRPKRYLDEQTEENATLPSPAPKKRRGASPPAPDKDKEVDRTESKPKEKQLNTVTQAELEDLKEPFTAGIDIINNKIPQVVITPISQERIIANTTPLVDKVVPTFNKTQTMTNQVNPKTASVKKPKKFIPPMKTTENSVEKPCHFDNNSNEIINNVKNDCNTSNEVDLVELENVKINFDNYNNESNVIHNDFQNFIVKDDNVLSDNTYKHVTIREISNIDSYNSELNCFDLINLFDEATNDSNNSKALNPVINSSEANNLNINNTFEEIVNVSYTNDELVSDLTKKINDSYYSSNPVDVLQKRNINDNSKNSNKKNKDKFALNGLILGSLNVLNDTNSFMTNISQTSNYSDSSVDTVRRIESSSSVVALNKTYKDLDLKSFENYNKLCSVQLKDCIKPLSQENSLNCIDVNENNALCTNNNHIIPTGEDYFNLFKVNFNSRNLNTKKVKYVAMTTEFGDMGFNMNYSDYVKQYGNYYEDCQEYEELTRKILEMYPDENRILINRKLYK